MAWLAPPVRFRRCNNATGRAFVVQLLKLGVQELSHQIEHVALTCADCGSNKFVVPNQPALDDDIVNCAECGGEIGRHDDIRGAVRMAGRAPILKVLEEVLGPDPVPVVAT